MTNEKKGPKQVEYDPAWTDFLGYMSGALPYARGLIKTGKEHYEGWRVNSSGYLEIFTITADGDDVSPVITLKTSKGGEVRMVPGRIEVYEKSWRSGDKPSKIYRAFLKSESGVEWRLTQEIKTVLHEIDDSVPDNTGWYMNRAAKLLRKLWTSGPEVPVSIQALIGHFDVSHEDSIASFPIEKQQALITAYSKLAMFRRSVGFRLSSRPEVDLKNIFLHAREIAFALQLNDSPFGKRDWSQRCVEAVQHVARHEPQYVEVVKAVTAPYLIT